MRRSYLFLSIFILCIIIYFIYDILNASGYFKKIEPHGFLNTERISLPVSGPEDLSLDTITGNLFISADDRRINQQHPGRIRGKIFRLNLQDSAQVIHDLTPETPSDFHPHGIALWRTDSGKLFVFAVNHRAADKVHAIERFEYKDEHLTHLETISDMSIMTSPNDLVATGPRTFYVTNDHYYAQEGISRTLEDYLQRAISYISYYDGKAFSIQATGIAYANGIQGNADRSEIYAAATTGRKILIFDADPSNGHLILKKEIFTETGVDNIELDGNGNLWIGSHPQLLKFVAHASSPSNFSPSQVIRLKRNDDGNFLQEEVFLNDGEMYSGSTTGIPYKNKIYIGSVFESSILKVLIDKN